MPKKNEKWILGRWGKEIKGHPSEANHEIGTHIDGVYVPIAFVPVAQVVEDMEPNGKGGDRVAKRVTITKAQSLQYALRIVKALNAQERKRK